MLKLSLKQGQYVNIGDDIRVVYVGGSGNHARKKIRHEGEKPIMQSRAFPERHSRKLRESCGTSG